MSLTAFNRRRRELAKAKAEAEARAREAQKPKTLNQMNKAELTAKAVELSITVPADATNKQIVELIEAKLTADAQPPAQQPAQ